MKILLLFLVINFNTQVQMRKEISKYLEEYIYTVEQRGNEYVNPFLVYTLYIHSNDNQDGMPDLFGKMNGMMNMFSTVTENPFVKTAMKYYGVVKRI